MKITLVLTLAALAATTQASIPAIPTDRMGQFLQDKSGLESELSSWKQSDAGQFAEEHGFVPAASAREASSARDEELRRFFLAKLLIEEAQATNPDAVFSTDTPFTLMTEDEFTKFVGASYQRGSGFLSETPTIEVASNSTEPVGTEKDWTTSDCVVPVKNQGQCGSCWAFAAVASLESALCLSGRPLTPLSEQQLLDCDESSYACQGGFPGDALNFIQRSGGVCLESGYPYVSGDTGDRATCRSSSCKQEAVAIRRVVAVPESDSGLVQAISGRPVAVGVAAGNPTWKQYKGGVVASCTTSELDHAVLAVGYTPSYFKIKNSWGTQWGEEGFIRLKRGAGTDSSGTCGIVGPKSVYPQL